MSQADAQELFKWNAYATFRAPEFYRKTDRHLFQTRFGEHYTVVSLYCESTSIVVYNIVHKIKMPEMRDDGYLSWKPLALAKHAQNFSILGRPIF